MKKVARTILFWTLILGLPFSLELTAENSNIQRKSIPASPAETKLFRELDQILQIAKEGLQKLKTYRYRQISLSDEEFNTIMTEAKGALKIARKGYASISPSHQQALKFKIASVKNLILEEDVKRAERVMNDIQVFKVEKQLREEN